MSKRGASKAKKSSFVGMGNVPGWLWLVTGVIAGLLIAFLFREKPGSTHIEKMTGNPDTALHNKFPAPVFEFYTLLPESEVVIDKEEKPLIIAEKPAEKSSKSNDLQAGETTSSKEENRTIEQYLLQAGSFRSLKDAERLQAQLIVWGLDPNVERVSVGENEFWHRVQVGPFSDWNTLNNVRETLTNHKVETLLLKMR